ncbi:hypothetical protein LXL04_015294 [Taraxacum kok-saghyz]
MGISGDGISGDIGFSGDTFYASPLKPMSPLIPSTVRNGPRIKASPLKGLSPLLASPLKPFPVYHDQIHIFLHFRRYSPFFSLDPATYRRIALSSGTFTPTTVPRPPPSSGGYNHSAKVLEENSGDRRLPNFEGKTIFCLFPVLSLFPPGFYPPPSFLFVFEAFFGRDFTPHLLLGFSGDSITSKVIRFSVYFRFYFCLFVSTGIFHPPPSFLFVFEAVLAGILPTTSCRDFTTTSCRNPTSISCPESDLHLVSGISPAPPVCFLILKFVL